MPGYVQLTGGQEDNYMTVFLMPTIYMRRIVLRQTCMCAYYHSRTGKGVKTTLRVVCGNSAVQFFKTQGFPAGGIFRCCNHNSSFFLNDSKESKMKELQNQNHIIVGQRE